MKKWLRYFLILLLMALSFALSAQNKAELQSEKKRLENEIAYNNSLLKQTEKIRKKSLNQIVILKNSLAKQKLLILNINSEIGLLNREITQNISGIEQAEADLVALKSEYAKMIKYAYRNSNVHSRLAFIFSSKDFNQAYKRIKYIQQYADFRALQVEAIVAKQAELKERNSALVAQKEKKLILKSDVVQEEKKLAESKLKENETYRVLISQEKALKKKIKRGQKAAKALEKNIEAIIAEEIRKAAVRQKVSGSGGEQFALTPEEQRLSDDFVNNKGRLPWPTERGIISSKFGEHPHPIMKKITVKNNGIDILTKQGEDARVVFAGEVVRVFTAPNYNNVVLVRHGQYLTMYAHLDAVYVKSGDKLKTKQKIGIIHTDPQTGKTEIHFEVWKSKTIQNPKLWIMKRK